MILYVTLGSNDLARSRVFYDAALTPLGLACHVAKDDEIGYGPTPAPASGRQCSFWLVSPYMKLPATWGNGTTVALIAGSCAMVDAFYEAAMQNGGIDEGKPGLRPFHDKFYAAFVRDPDGNKLSAVCEN